MTAPTRYYAISDRATGKTVRLVRSTTQDRALAHYVADTLAVRLATQDDIIAAVEAGVPRDNGTTNQLTDKETA